MAISEVFTTLICSSVVANLLAVARCSRMVSRLLTWGGACSARGDCSVGEA